MNRREFVGTIVGAAAVAKLGGGDSFYGFAEESTAATRPEGAWIDNGIIDAGGSHEPYLFVVRRGGESLNARHIYEREQSEGVIRLLRSQGVEVFHTHLYKGFGMATELPEMQDTVRTAAIAHRYGMKIDTYVQWDTMMYETFFAEEPRAQQWIQRDVVGKPILLTYGYQQSFRYRPCFSNQEYLNYLKKILRFAVEEVKTDFIHFDNFSLNPEPDSCHCDGCKAGFRNYLRKKYSAAELKERFGFVNVDYINPPLWNRQNPPEKLNIIFDPGFQEWIDYRCQMMTDALEQMATEIRSLNPNVVVEINPGGISGNNSPWLNGIDHSRLLKHTEAFWDEARNLPEYFADNRMVSGIRTYKLARTYKNIVFNYTDTSEAAIGECLAFNQTIGFAGENPLTKEMLKYISFYRKNRDCYVGTQDIASVAVLRSYPSMTYHHSRAGLSAILVEQTLIQARIPFHMIFDEHLATLSPSACKVLILPDSECLSDSQIASIRNFVEAGGGLIATEQAGLYDQWRRSRSTRGLKGLVDNQVRGSSYEESVKQAVVAMGVPSRKEVGRGRVYYIPGLEFDGPLPLTEPYFSLGNSFWKRPKNWKQLVDGIIWVSEGDIPLTVEGPDYLVANLVEQPHRSRRFVHLINYNFKNIPSIQNIEMRCTIPDGKQVIAVRVYSTESEAPTSLQFQIRDRMVVATIPHLNTYCMVEIS
jgi:Beta-galactosidase